MTKEDTIKIKRKTHPILHSILQHAEVVDCEIEYKIGCIINLFG